MSDPLTYHKPEPPDPAVQRRRRAHRTVLVGTTIFTIAILLILSPLLMGPGTLNKYIVAFGFLGACWGVCCLLLGAWDWVRG